MRDDLLSEQERLAFVRSAVTRMAEYTRPYLVSLIALQDQANTGRHQGTGFRCVLSGGRCVVTANHVWAMAARSPDGFAISTAHDRSPWRWGDGHGLALPRLLAVDNGDLAVLPTPPAYQELLSDQDDFWPEERVDCSAEELDHDLLFIHGFPGVSTRWTSFEGGGINYRSLPYGV